LMPDPDSVAEFREKLSRLRPWTLEAYVVGALTTMVRRWAAEHGSTCKGCKWCGELKIALSLVAVHQKERASELNLSVPQGGR
jgi:hypothetical protein